MQNRKLYAILSLLLVCRADVRRLWPWRWRCAPTEEPAAEEAAAEEVAEEPAEEPAEEATAKQPAPRKKPPPRLKART